MPGADLADPSRSIDDRRVPYITIAAPILCALLEANQAYILGSYRLGLELLMLNGLMVFAGLYAISRPEQAGREAVAA